MLAHGVDVTHENETQKTDINEKQHLVREMLYY